MSTISYDLLGGLAIAFALGALAVWLDIRDTLKSQLGASTTMTTMLAGQGWWFLLAWGSVDALIFLIVISHPVWAKATFQFDFDQNKLLAGATVGLSAVFVIRSKLTKIGNVEIGGEWAYLWSRAYLLSSVSQRWGLERIGLLADYETVTKDPVKFPNFYTDLEHWLTEQSKVVPDDKDFVIGQMALIRKQAAANILLDPNARRDLAGLGIDFLGPTNFEKWAKRLGYA